MSKPEYRQRTASDWYQVQCSLTAQLEHVQRERDETREKIKSLQRTNEVATKYASSLVDALQRRFYPDVTGWTKLPDLIGMLTQIDNMTACAAAITPEMRERIEEVLRRTDEGYAYDLRKSGTLRGILHDLLKETVEPTLEGEQ